MKCRYICEVCERIEVMTPEDAYREGWDYPPYMGDYGVVSPRLCPGCTIMKTAWAAIMFEKKGFTDLTEKQKMTIFRIKGEPQNMILEDDTESEEGGN